MRYLTAAETAKIIKGILRREYPETTFSVTSKSYAGGASIRVVWTDGPNRREIEHLVGRFEGADFDGMNDLKTYRGPIEWQGEQVHSHADFIFCEHLLGEAAMERLAKKTRARYSLDGDYTIVLRDFDSMGGFQVLASPELDGQALAVGGHTFAPLVYVVQEEEERGENGR